MTTVLTFDVSRCRQPATPLPALIRRSGLGQILMFTGVRREILSSKPAPHHPEPMFVDPEPGKPRGRKRRR